jgi:hypothetical protein
VRYFIVNGVPVAQENEPSAEFYTKDSWTPISEAQFNELKNPTPIEPSEFELKKAIKQDAFNAYAYAFIYNGYTDTITGHKLFTGPEEIKDYALVASSAQMVKEANLDSFMMEFGTYQGWVVESARVVKDLFSRYTEFTYPIAAKIQRLKGEIQRATTIEEIEAIVI